MNCANRAGETVAVFFSDRNVSKISARIHISGKHVDQVKVGAGGTASDRFFSQHQRHFSRAMMRPH
jgi:hypothetical protein